MLQRSEIRDPMETPEMGAASPHASEALKIEEILRRAREIHRQHGGMFGYDFEDWVQAWSEPPEKAGRPELNPADGVNAGLLAADRGEVSAPCF
jgi:hypothetical protein